MAVRELKIGASGVRGVVGDGLTPELIVDFACAFGTWSGGGPVVIGRDPRRSSTAFRAAVVSGLLSTGCEVIDLAVCSSPLVSFAIREIGASGGVAVTGSHNDASWNALKFFGPDGALLNAAKNGELLDLYHGAAYERAAWDRLRPVAAAPGVEERYLDHLATALDVDRIRERRFRVALDFTNGACGPVASRFLERLGCALLPVNAEATGEFAHPPAPTAANMRQVASLTRRLGADLGAALNVDGDRIGFVTADGAPLSEEYSLPLAAVPRLRRRPGAVVTSFSTSGMVKAVARAHGQRVLRGPVGESQIVDLGLAEGAVLAGEGSGGLAALPFSMVYDGLLALGLVLEEMATGGRSLQELAAGFPTLFMRKREVPCPPSLVYKVLDRFRRHHAAGAPDCTDGVRLAWERTPGFTSGRPRPNRCCGSSRRPRRSRAPRRSWRMPWPSPAEPRADTRGSEPMRQPLSLKFGPSGVRGAIGESLTPQLVTSFAAAFGTYCGAGPILVGTDTRPSGEMVKQAAIAGLLGVGCTPVDCGVAPVPALMFHVREAGALGGIFVGGSDRSPEWNALRFIGPGGLSLRAVQAAELTDLYHQGVYPRVRAADMPDVGSDTTTVARHLRGVMAAVDVERIRSRAFRVAVDPLGGAAAAATPRLLEALGCGVVIAEAGPDPRPPAQPLDQSDGATPGDGALNALGDLVRRSGADAGFAQDGDADRLAVVDEHGVPLGGDGTLVLVLQRCLERAPGPVVVDVSASRMVDDLAATFGCAVHRSPVGEAKVLEAMTEHGAQAGGESDGGAIVLPVNPCRDSFAAMSLILEAMATSGRSVGALRARVPSYSVVRERLLCPARDIAPSLRLIRAIFHDERLDLTDGVKVTWPDRWLLARASATEPVIRLAAEAPTEPEARALLNRVLEVLSPGG